jgi:predicted DNA-binding transcriptional regulator YafY
MSRVIERILNLLAYLLTVDRPVTADEIRHTVAGYDQPEDEAFRRMFERDKDLLRQLGIRLEMAPTDAWEVEFGYIVPEGGYELADPGLTDEERAALWLAAQVVRLGGQPSGPEAIFKLGGAPSLVAGEPLAADLGGDSQLLGTVFAAVSERRVLQFTYRDKKRRLHPYGMVHRRGHWYVTGVQVGEKDARVFRLDRMEKTRAGDEAEAFVRPGGFSAGAVVGKAPWEAGGDDIEAIVQFDAEVAWWARPQLAGAEVSINDDDSLTARIRVANPDAFIGWILGFVDQAEVIEPVELRDRVMERAMAKA